MSTRPSPRRVSNVRPKKHLGQHFLHDERTAERIVGQLTGHGNWQQVLEVGPGTGVLTKYLAERPEPLWLIEVDEESVAYLRTHYPALEPRLHHADFLHTDLREVFAGGPTALIGNFPYNISSQIFFKVLEHRQHFPEVVGMLQREVAQRLAAGPGSKTYGILSVLLQAFYDVEYCFTVSEGVFRPPPKVKSGVLRLRRNDRAHLPCNERRFFQVVKMAFNQRRKTLRNALKPMLPKDRPPPEGLERRAEQLSVEAFIDLTLALEEG
ncbi:MAG: 16S rRNA (adenine(1518)-N(6)/adenine(1519)-N(6))-dimethyltransferase RsmA [Catalinimonas sp.]